MRHLRIIILSCLFRKSLYPDRHEGDRPMPDARDTPDTLADLKDRGARRMALLIAGLAALLAIVQTIGDNAPRTP